MWKTGHPILIWSFLLWDQGVNVRCPPSQGNCPPRSPWFLWEPSSRVGIQCRGAPETAPGERILEGRAWCFIWTCRRLNSARRFIGDHLKIRLAVCRPHLPVAFLLLFSWIPRGHGEKDNARSLAVIKYTCCFRSAEVPGVFLISA